MSLANATPNTRRLATKEEPHDGNTLHTLIKHEQESNEDHDFAGNGDDDDDDNEDCGYVPRPQLPMPQVNLRSLADLMRGLEDNSIDVNPEYQREVVWTADRMTGLVNSLMENFYIPPIILNGKQTRVIRNGRPTTNTTYVCVDGKQRLSSVRAFIKGMIPCHDHRGEKWWFGNDGGRRRKLLPEATQREFLNKDLVAYQFEGLSQEQEEDLFARVQMGMTLTAAEKMRASSGPWQELARLFVDDFPTVYGLMKDRARAKDFQLTLSCFSQIVEVMHPSASNGAPIMKTNHSALPKFLNNKSLVDDGIKSHLASVWNTFKELVDFDPDTFTNANKYLGGVQTFAPVEMVAVTVMISMYSDTRNNRLLLGDIRDLREELRKRFVDLRLNLPTWKFLWEYLDDLEGIRGAVDGSTVNRPRMDPVPGSSLGSAPTPTRTAVPAGSIPTKAVPRRGGPTIVPALNTAAVSRPRSTAKNVSKKKVVSVQTANVGRSPGTATPPPLIRSPKRQRTDPGSLLWMPSQTSDGATIQSPRVDAAVRFHQDINSLAGTEQSLFIPEATPINTVVPSQQPMIHHTAMMHQDAHNIPSPRISPVGSSQQVPSKAPQPSQVQQNRISQPHNYRTPSFTRSTYGHSYEAVASPHPSGSISSGQAFMKIGVGAYVPRHIEDQWVDIIRSISPQIPPQTTPATPFAQPQTQNKRKNFSSFTPSQIQETIDLTDDTAIELVEPELVERERQNLLSSFKGRPTAGKQSQAPATSAIVPPNVAMYRSSAAEVDMIHEDAHPLLNNPYAKFKKQGVGQS